MTNELNSKRLSDDELEAVAGGVTAPTIDPSALAALMHTTVGAAVAGGGAYTVDTSTPTHTDSSTPTITNDTHVVVSGSSVFAGISAPIAPPAQSSWEPVTGTVTVSGSLHVSVPTVPDTTVTVMHFDSPEGQFTHVTPTVVGVQDPSASAPVGAAASREGVAFNP